MPSNCSIEFKEVKPKLSSAKGAIKITAAIPKGIHLIVLDERGKSPSTQALANQLVQWHQDGVDVAFLIGDADDLDASIKQKADAIWRLSGLTLPHTFLYLASPSPRRQELLTQLGVRFELILSGSDENAETIEMPLPNENAKSYVERMTLAKCNAAAQREARSTLGADFIRRHYRESPQQKYCPDLGQACGCKRCRANLTLA